MLVIPVATIQVNCNCPLRLSTTTIWNRRLVASRRVEWPDLYVCLLSCRLATDPSPGAREHRLFVRR